MLQSGCSHGEFHCSLGVLAGEQGVDQAAAEAVATANTVDDVQVILLGEAVLVLGNVIQHGAPAVVEGRVAFPQSDGYHFKAELVRQLFGNGLVALVVQAAAVDVGGLSLDAEDILGVLFVGNAHIHVLAQIGHGFPSLSAGPQLAAVVQVAGDLAAMGLGGLAGFPADFHNVGAQSRSDAGEVEPVGTLEDLVPVEVRGLRLLNGGMGTVINADGATLRSALLVEVNTHTVTAPDDQGGVYAITAQGIHSGLADGVGGQLGDESGIHAVVGKGHCDIGLAAAKGEFHMVALNEALIVIRLQAEHQLAEGYDSCHYFLASLTISTDFLHSSVISSQAPAWISLSGHM